MIIFTGTGRSGSGLYARLFHAHHEYNVAHLTGYMRYRENSQAAPFEDLETRRRIMQKHLEGVDIRTFRDSSNPYIHFLDALYDIDPSVKIVLGVRDGRDFVRSAITRGYHDERKYPLYSMIPTTDDPYYGQWHRMTPLERCAWIWQYRNRKALERWERVPEENKLIVRVEDLSTEGTIKRLEDFLDARADRKWIKKRVNANKQLLYPPKDEWSDEMNSRFYRIAGDMMERLEYPVSRKTYQLPDFERNVSSNLTIGMPVYNEEDFIEEAIESLLGQTYTDFILHISDNGSTDRTPEICEEFAKQDRRISITKQQKNIGSLANFKYVLDQAHTRFFMWAGGHDKWHPEFIETLLPIIEANEKLVLAYPQTRQIGKDGSKGRVYEDDYSTTQIKDAGARYYHILKDVGVCNIIHGIWRTSTLKRSPFRSIIGPDHLILASAALEGKFKQLDSVLFYRRNIRTESNQRQRWSRQLAALTGNHHEVSFHKSWEVFRFAIEHVMLLIMKRRMLRGVQMLSLATMSILLPIRKFYSFGWVRRLLSIAGK